MTDSPLDGAYMERALVLAALSRVWAHLGYRQWIGYDEAEGDEWPVFYCELPTGQVSWHLTSGQRSLFNHVDTSSAWVWDKHTTDEKYDRLRRWASQYRPWPI